MRKGAGPIAIAVIALVVVLLIEFIGITQFIFRTETFVRSIRETNILQGINLLEFVKRALPQALKYSFYQGSYLVSPQGGYYHTEGIDSLQCVPYWRNYGLTNYPGFSSIGKVMLGFFNDYGEEFDDVYVPTYTGFLIENVNVGEDPGARIQVLPYSNEKLRLEREKVKIEDKSMLDETFKTSILKMYKKGEENFVDVDKIQTTVKNAIDNMPSECKHVDLGDDFSGEAICYIDEKPKVKDNSNWIELDAASVLSAYCSDWESILKRKIFNEINSMELDTGDIGIIVNVNNEDQDTSGSFDGECSASAGNSDLDNCGCADTWEVDCGGYSVASCSEYALTKGCHDCYYPDDLHKGCFCAPGCSNTKCSGCKTPQKRANTKCDFSYYGSAIVSVEITDESRKYPVYDGTTDFRDMKLNFRVLSGNVYEDITNKLVNPSFEGEEPQGERQTPGGWGLEYSDSLPECLHKCSRDLPENEWLGRPNALILEGDCTYKISQGFQGFFGILRQTVSGLEPDSIVMVEIPIQVHTNRGAGIEEAIIKVTINGEGEEIKGYDRQWVHVGAQAQVKEDGLARIVIYVQSKSQGGIDFFIDNIKLYKFIHEEFLGTDTDDRECMIDFPEPTPPIPSEGDITSCPDPRINSYIDDYNTHSDVISDSISDESLTSYLSQGKADPLVSAIITQESRWDQSICSETIGCGIMQITKVSSEGCSDLGGWVGIKGNVNKNIRCGVRILKNKFNHMKNLNEHNEENLIKLTLASYNGGQSTIQRAIDNAGGSKWRDITLNNLAESCEHYEIWLDPEKWCPDTDYDGYECKAHIIQVYVDHVYGYYQEWSRCERSS